MDYAEVQALEVYQQIQRHGWPMVEALRTFHLTEQEAEALFLRVDWLAQYLPGLLAAFYGQESASNGQGRPAYQHGDGVMG